MFIYIYIYIALVLVFHVIRNHPLKLASLKMVYIICGTRLVLSTI